MKRTVTAACFALILSACSLVVEKKCIEDYYVDERLIYLGGQASVFDLYQVLHDWGKIKRAIKEYVDNNVKRYYFYEGNWPICYPDGLTIEHLEGLSVLTEEESNEYHPELKKIADTQNTVLRVMVTTHPCYPELGGLYADTLITWFYLRVDGQYIILDKATISGLTPMAGE